jgi:hypothetical protein
MLAILFQVDGAFCLVFVTGFIIVVTLNVELVRVQRICVKLCVRLRKTAAETHIILREAGSDDALSHTTTYRWFKYFKN